MVPPTNNCQMQKRTEHRFYAEIVTRNTERKET